MVRKKVGRVGFKLDYQEISREYIGGKYLKDLAMKYDVSQWTLLDNFKKLGVRKTTKRYQDISVFDKFTPESCYWAGFLSADGWVTDYSMGVELSSVDKNHLVLLIDFLKSNADIASRVKINELTGKKYKYSTALFYSVDLVNILKCKFNIVPNKSLIYSPPTIPVELCSHFIRGYIDGDGSIGWSKSNNKPRINLGCGSLELVQWVKDKIEENVINTGNPSISKNTYDRKNPLYALEYLGYQTENILDWIYKDSTKQTRLSRKYTSYLKYINKLNKQKRVLENKENSRTNFIQELVSMYESGMSSRNISDELNISQQKVLYYLRISNTDMKTSNNQNIVGSERNKRDIRMLRLYENGSKPKDIAKLNDLALSSFWVAIRRAKQLEA